MPPNDDTTTDDQQQAGGQQDDSSQQDQPDGGQDSGQQDDSDGGQPGDGQLGDAGKKALAAERRARRDAERARRTAEEQNATLLRRLAKLTGGQQQNGQQDGSDGDEPDADDIRRDAEKQAAAKANERILRSEVRAAAAGKLADPADALRFLDLTQFEVGDDGEVDEEEITNAIDDLVTKKPYLAPATGGRFQGSGDGGARQQPAPKQVTREQLRRMTPAERMQAHNEGRTADLLKQQA